MCSRYYVDDDTVYEIEKRSSRSKLLINARAETVLERRMFRDSVLHRRQEYEQQTLFPLA